MQTFRYSIIYTWINNKNEYLIASMDTLFVVLQWIIAIFAALIISPVIVTLVLAVLLLVAALSPLLIFVIIPMIVLIVLVQFDCF